MSISKLFPTLSKPVPSWLTWGIILVLISGCAFFHFQATEVEREFYLKKVVAKKQICDRARAGDKVALIQLAGLLASDEPPDFARVCATRIIEGINVNANANELASFIAEFHHLIRFDQQKATFVWTKESLAKLQNPAASQPTQ